ncbi:2-oxo acid dehydrogenase subunit E2 [Microbacterium sp. zg.B48]|uniref:dihydrolipoamide acetyltransferase family protein n=1 Tax=Microbacterium sp. zg.B48 TaxID=2969408 RepID=UPI00214AC54A|nr:dihydrolipoamide acetyltransferase family protein [Microbacterium sp. zg.B48]MCR2762548.1 2-oxo acid dehydrogenase subunit E2 [Microbacterium sp. zg.B48]
MGRPLMGVVVRMPQLAAGGNEAAIQTWLIDVGDQVTVGQAIVEIETEKAVVEYEAEADGTIAGVLVAAGETATVGSPIAVLAAPGESAEEALRSVEATATAAAAVAQDAAPTPTAEVTTATAAAASTPAAAPGGAGSRLFASPLVRRLARERGIDLSAVVGSGPNGRVVRRDLDAVLTAALGGSARAAVPPAPASASAHVDAVPDQYTDIPHTGMRRAIARRLGESTATVPHFYLVADCRVDELLAVRARINDAADVSVSVNDLVVKAVAAALQDVPEANAIWTDDAIRRFTGVDLAIAVAVPGGLLTPVVQGVERMPLGELSRAIRDLAERARAGRLRQHELEGGSFSVSNLGMYGTREFSAIINPPQAGIFAVGAATRRPVVDADGELAVATVMTVTLSADHRVLDGALAAQLLAAFVRRIENPVSVLV